MKVIALRPLATWAKLREAIEVFDARDRRLLVRAG